jgi:hypothetical protein
MVPVSPLLRDLLQHRLSLEQLGVTEDLHLRAARWFAEQGEPIHAIRHATLARDRDEARRPAADQLGAAPDARPDGPALAAALEPGSEGIPMITTTTAPFWLGRSDQAVSWARHMLQRGRAVVIDCETTDLPAAFLAGSAIRTCRIAHERGPFVGEKL